MIVRSCRDRTASSESPFVAAASPLLELRLKKVCESKVLATWNGDYAKGTMSGKLRGIKSHADMRIMQTARRNG
ncbi:unnamed protein product [Penicillium camemberti]|uniref:Str. FM013 n=1 Tax=Penicillium camemberti (strain FM 013) TaxID=1429867 RepID=A0A0G4PRH5_PENC3|nr:unnamed protein product [Penicillium camemberti]